MGAHRSSWLLSVGLGLHHPRKIFEVDVEGNGTVAPGVIQAGGQRRLLAEVAGEINHHEAGIFPMQGQQSRQGVVGAAIVDADHL